MKGLNILPTDIGERLTHIKATRKAVLRFFSEKPSKLERWIIREEELASKGKMYLMTLSVISIRRKGHLTWLKSETCYGFCDLAYFRTHSAPRKLKTRHFSRHRSYRRTIYLQVWLERRYDVGRRVLVTRPLHDHPICNQLPWPRLSNVQCSCHSNTRTG